MSPAKEPVKSDKDHPVVSDHARTQPLTITIGGKFTLMKSFQYQKWSFLTEKTRAVKTGLMKLRCILFLSCTMKYKPKIKISY